MDNKDHNHDLRSNNRTGTQHRTSRHDKNSSIDCCNREESCSPNPTKTAATDPPITNLTEARDVKEDVISDRSIELETEGTAESMAKMIEIRNYFDYDLQPRSLYYLDSTFWDPKQRAAEYRWVHNVTMCDILLKADEINTNGNEELRAQRRALVDRVNAILDDLETAKKKFDEQDEKWRKREGKERQEREDKIQQELERATKRWDEQENDIWQKFKRLRRRKE
ncbi:hypothetical protein RRF57_004055 [Xylaria bambusicola]|uniref:BAG domain-containing protein n=1 Tax=Xylaria bambusicola TaxID=326684 RepID=A0AAN7YWT1_9PEZI